MAENVYDGYQAGHVNVERSAVRSLAAQTATMHQSAAQRLEAGSVTAHDSALGAVQTSTFEMRGSSAAVVAGDYVVVENSRIAVLMAPRVSGNVKAVITVPAAFAFGIGYFIARRLAGAYFSKRRR